MKNVVFDVGNVLIRWDVRALYRQYLPDDEAIDAFVKETDLMAMNIEFDRGKPFDEGIKELAARHPQHSELLFAFKERWSETVVGAIEGTVSILKELREAGVPTYAITNFSAETWPIAVKRFPFLGTHFNDVVVSGEVRLIKPGEAIYRTFLDRNKLEADSCIFIDDSPANVAAAAAVGMDAVQFIDPAQLRIALAKAGIVK